MREGAGRERMGGSCKWVVTEDSCWRGEPQSEPGREELMWSWGMGLGLRAAGGRGRARSHRSYFIFLQKVKAFYCFSFLFKNR